MWTPTLGAESGYIDKNTGQEQPGKNTEGGTMTPFYRRLLDAEVEYRRSRIARDFATSARWEHRLRRVLGRREPVAATHAQRPAVHCVEVH